MVSYRSTTRYILYTYTLTCFMFTVHSIIYHVCLNTFYFPYVYINLLSITVQYGRMMYCMVYYVGCSNFPSSSSSSSSSLSLLLLFINLPSPRLRETHTSL